MKINEGWQEASDSIIIFSILNAGFSTHMGCGHLPFRDPHGHTLCPKAVASKRRASITTEADQGPRESPSQDLKVLLPHVQ
jgi:hypothetical protein